MATYCVSCERNIATKKYSNRKTKENRLVLLSVCAACGKKESRLIKSQELYY